MESFQLDMRCRCGHEFWLTGLRRMTSDFRSFSVQCPRCEGSVRSAALGVIDPRSVKYVDRAASP